MDKDYYANLIIAEGQRRGISPRGIVIGLATALTESNLIMYANASDPDTLKYPHEAISYDYNSSGLFQQRPPWWGTAAQRMDPASSAGMFFAALELHNYDGEMSPGWYAQQVQDSQYPDRYDQRMDEAQNLYDRLVSAGMEKEIDSMATPAEDVQLQTRGPGLAGWPARRYDKGEPDSDTQPKFSMLDFDREIDKKINSVLGLEGRPGPDEDDLFGHILSMRAEFRKILVIQAEILQKLKAP